MKTLMMTAAVAVGIVINVANAAPLPEAKPNDVGFSQQGLARLDDFFAREILAKRVPGAVVAIARDGKLVHYMAYGQLDATKGTPMPLDAVFALASDEGLGIALDGRRGPVGIETDERARAVRPSAIHEAGGVAIKVMNCDR
jgi:hypothetical protein